MDNTWGLILGALVGSWWGSSPSGRAAFAAAEPVTGAAACEPHRKCRTPVPPMEPHHQQRGTMRILHTSDWHLGRTLHKTSLRAAQESAMDQIVAIAADHEVDLVVVSGDVFDHAVPSAEALELLEDTLSRLLGIAATVVTAGNHDSLRRLGCGSRLFNDRLFLRTRLGDRTAPVFQ